MGQRKHKINNIGGFTLIEVVVVMAVLTILVGVAVPSLSAYHRNGLETQRAGQEELVGRALRQYYAYEGEYPDLEGLSPSDGSRTLSGEQMEQLQGLLKSVTSVNINIDDYTYTYHEGTGACALALN